MAASATFALKVGVWFRRGRLFMVSPDSLGTACPLSARNSTYRPVQISETSSIRKTVFARSYGRARDVIRKVEAQGESEIEATPVHFLKPRGFPRGCPLLHR